MFFYDFSFFKIFGTDFSLRKWIGITVKLHILTFREYFTGSGESSRFVSKLRFSLKQLLNSGRTGGRTDGRTGGRKRSLKKEYIGARGP